MMDPMHRAANAVALEQLAGLPLKSGIPGVCVRPISFIELLRLPESPLDARCAAMLAACVCDEIGVALFDGPGDPNLLAMSVQNGQKLLALVQEVSGLNDAGQVGGDESGEKAGESVPLVTKS